MKASAPAKESSMHQTEPSATLLPYAAPASPYRRLLLFAIRRMAAGGIADAHAAHALFTGFGVGYRRPLILLRALMAELSRVSAARLSVAHCCCARMTREEDILLKSMALAQAEPRAAHDQLRRLLHVRSCLGVLSSTQAVAGAFADLGMPIESDCISCNYDEAF
jgi:hypothetical protein